MPNLSVLYSFRRCPYAMRARMALYVSQVELEIREVDLRNKPAEMLMSSPKATVPVFVTGIGEVIDESLDIMRWALAQNDPQQWLKTFSSEMVLQMDTLIHENDTVFKQHLDHYKYSDRFPESPVEFYRQQGEAFLSLLEQRLESSKYLFSDHVSLADIAIFPFVRQFAAVDFGWFEQSPYLKLQRWLQLLLDSEQFQNVMKKLPIWKSGDDPIIFSADP